ncbi:MAG: hypothetical protein Q7S17_00890 [Xanthobacteraceae bacterium]|nr:hypothetical protein [Xanthobacteraceae bacterium]
MIKTSVVGWRAPRFVTRSLSIIRPADTTAYAVDDVLSAVAVEFGILTDAAGAADLSGVITDMVVISTNGPATPLQGELWLFDSPVTAVADNAAFALSDAHALFLVGIVPFTMVSQASNSVVHVVAIDMAFTTVAGRDLYTLVKVKNAYTPASLETVTFRLKIRQEG